MSIQPLKEIEDFYNKKDPWGYEGNPADRNRKSILMTELSHLESPPGHVLDIGCGHGFITRDLPGKEIVGVDISQKAIEQAKKISNRENCRYIAMDFFNLSRTSLDVPGGFDLIIITGTLYPQYVGKAKTVIYQIIDRLLINGGKAVSVHISEWYTARLPFILTKTFTYEYREYQHLLEVYAKP